MKNYFLLPAFIFVFLLGATSCFKEDIKIAPHPLDTTKVEMIAMTQYYVNQVYYNLMTGEQVSQNLKTDCDLLFSSIDTGFIIKLNTATFMMAAATTSTSFEEVSDTIGLRWQFDASSGNVDSLVFMDWMRFNRSDTIFQAQVYVVNRGINAIGNPLGLRKVIFNRLIGDKYLFSYCNMDNSDLHEVVIEKDPGHNTVQYSFTTHQSLQLEPLTNNWDLLFTQYSTMLRTDEGDNYPYLLTGVLINASDLAVSFDSTMVFNDVTVDEVLNLEYSRNLNVIGYNWKELVGDINGGDFYYKCNPKFNYFIQTRTGVFYKLRFTSFYDPVTGEKGYPTFEYRRL